MNHFKKEYYKSKTKKKKIKLYICRNRELEIAFSNCLICRENKLSTIKFRNKLYIISNLKIIIYYHVSRRSVTSNTNDEIPHFIHPPMIHILFNISTFINY